MKSKRMTKIEPVYVDEIPRDLENGKLYINEEYGVAVHACACGCGERTVTPLDPVDGWELVKNTDETVTLHPSIGNYYIPCKSHYFIQNNNVVWCRF